jgi:hypothetical protein
MADLTATATACAAAVSAMTTILQLSGAKRTFLLEKFLQPAAVGIGAPPRSKGRGTVFFSTAPRSWSLRALNRLEEIADASTRWPASQARRPREITHGSAALVSVACAVGSLTRREWAAGDAANLGSLNRRRLATSLLVARRIRFRGEAVVNRRQGSTESVENGPEPPRRNVSCTISS